jgi:hypothetical protein
MVCNGDCPNCKYPDCVASYQEISKLEVLERQRRREEKKKYLEQLEAEMRERKNNCKTKIN